MCHSHVSVSAAAAATFDNSTITPFSQASQWGRFAQRLSDKMHVVKVPAAYTSQCCHECGHIAQENRESQAEFLCKRCGHTANADVNAAKNIRELAVCGGTLREWAKAKADANLQTA